jgi:two-component system, OmpR family, alkaline phosphatase synthesis response regulator PhoP
MPGERILVVDDEQDILDLLEYALTREGYQVTAAGSGEEALRQVRAVTPDLIVLDLMLPGLDGLTLCTVLRTDPTTSAIPIIMLTARGEEADVVRGLQAGADDYVTKPFSPRVLAARVGAVLRRSPPEETAAEADVLSVGGITIHPGRREVRVGEEAVDLTYTEFAILAHLAARPGWVYSREQIVEAVRGGEYLVTPRAVDVQVVRLRRKLGVAGAQLETVRGVGYRLAR